MRCMNAANWCLAVTACLCVGGIKAVPTATPTPSSSTQPQPTVKPTSVFCTSTRCKNGGHCAVGDTKCTCVGLFSGKTCTKTPSPTPVPTQVTPPPTPVPTQAPGTPLLCPPTATFSVPLASGTYTISSSLVCIDPATSKPSGSFYEVFAGSVVVINIPVEGVTLTGFNVVISGGTVTINGGRIMYTGYTRTQPLDVYDGGILTINSDVVYTANSYQMIRCGSKDYRNIGLPLRPGGIVTFTGAGSFTSNVRTCDTLVCTSAAALALNNGCSLTFKKNVEFKFNTVPASFANTPIPAYGGAINVYESTLVFEADVIFDTNKAYEGVPYFFNLEALPLSKDYRLSQTIIQHYMVAPS